MKKLLTLTITLLVFPAMLFSQVAGKISGTVLNENGDALTGANVSVVGTSFGAATDTEGAYVILNVPVGIYSVKADYIGYKETSVSNVDVKGGLTVRQNFSLEISVIEGDVVQIIGEKKTYRA